MQPKPLLARGFFVEEDMLLKFISPDPRAGTVAQMDSSRGQDFIDSGAAVQIAEGDGGPTAGVTADVAEPVVKPKRARR